MKGIVVGVSVAMVLVYIYRLVNIGFDYFETAGLLLALGFIVFSWRRFADRE